MFVRSIRANSARPWPTSLTATCCNWLSWPPALLPVSRANRVVRSSPMLLPVPTRTHWSRTSSPRLRSSMRRMSRLMAVCASCFRPNTTPWHRTPRF
ncbi:hypothetical protein RSEGYP2_43 [Ralstonia phage RsoP1EGY]|uniref:Uncharacterized protein n=1 Tax=Ralstonia phage RsoP1EGY TaxID=2070026 RepID=A0A2R2ZGG4_9CAUD|nr:hypothetical protein HOT00_gp43 [Ralstonia phage RsoP1EGY]AUO78201.1 hypothetical protein RSEGYP2_43 [Ralstonia phage RsoP1EGY]